MIYSNKPYIIAGIGLNHDVSLKTAKELIEKSAEAGVISVKFQFRNLESVYSIGSEDIRDKLFKAETLKNYLSPQRY